MDKMDVIISVEELLNLVSIMKILLYISIMYFVANVSEKWTSILLEELLKFVSNKSRLWEFSITSRLCL